MNLLLLGSLNSSTNSETTLVLELGQLETIKVSQVSTNLALLELLGPGGLGPLLNGLVLLQSLLERGLTDGTGKILEDKRSQNHTTEGESLTSDTGGRTIDESAVMINNIDDDGQLAGIGTVLMRTTRPTST